MPYLKIIYTSAFSVLSLFVLCKLMGKRQISQLSMFDYINGISIGSIAAEMATESNDNPLKYITAMCVYTFISILITFLTSKSIKLRRLFEGESIILFNNGKIYKKNLIKSKLDLHEFLSLLRVKGYYGLKNIQTVIMETNGQLSVMPQPASEAVKRIDLNIEPQKNGIIYNIIIDGNLMQKNIVAAGISKSKIEKFLNMHNLTLEKVFLATYDNESEEILVYEDNNDDL